MTPDEREIISALGRSLLFSFHTQTIIILLYAIFLPLGLLSVQYSVKTPAGRKIALIMSFGALSVTSLALLQSGQVVLFISLGMIENIGTPLTKKRASANERLQPWNVAFDAVQLIPLLTNDALIIWRAWIIFSKRRWALYTLIMLWLLTAGVIFGTVIADYKGLPISIQLEHASLGLTFGTNFMAAFFIGCVIWGHRQMFKGLGLQLQHRSKVWKVLVLLFEMGFIYCLLQLVALIIHVQWMNSHIIVTLSFSQIFVDVIWAIYTVSSVLYPILIALVLQGPSVMLGLHETGTSIHETQIMVNMDIE